jgi:hypothetical protein
MPAESEVRATATTTETDLGEVDMEKADSLDRRSSVSTLESFQSADSRTPLRPH